MVAGTIVDIGVSTEEFGISLGDQVLVYGKVFWDRKNKLLVFNKPDYLVKSIKELKQILVSK